MLILRGIPCFSEKPITRRNETNSQKMRFDGINNIKTKNTFHFIYQKSIMRTPSQVTKLFSFAYWFGTKLRVFLICEMVRNGIPSTSSSREWLERNYDVPSGFLVCKMIRNGIPSIFISRGMVRNEIPSFFLSLAEWLGTESEQFLFRGTDGIPNGMNQNIRLSVFRGIFFLVNPSPLLCHENLTAKQNQTKS